VTAYCIGEVLEASDRDSPAKESSWLLPARPGESGADRLELSLGLAVWWSRCAWSVELRYWRPSALARAHSDITRGSVLSPGPILAGLFKKKPRRSGGSPQQVSRKGP